MSGQLLVDIGNQRIKWVVLDLRSKLELSSLETRIAQSMQVADLVAGESSVELFNEMFEHEPPQGLFVSSVSDQNIAAAFLAYCKRKWDCPTTVVRSEEEALGLINNYGNPSQLGVDRWLAALGAFKLSEQAGKDRPVIVVDAGTAITVDLISQGKYEGGSILPGIATLIASLGSRTGKIEVDVQQLTQSVFRTNAVNKAMNKAMTTDMVAKDSAAAVMAGVIASAAGGINYCIEKITAVLNNDAEVLLTGGDATVLGPLLNHHVKIVPNLVITGLAIIAMETNK